MGRVGDGRTELDAIDALDVGWIIVPILAEILLLLRRQLLELAAVLGVSHGAVRVEPEFVRFVSTTA